MAFSTGIPFRGNDNASGGYLLPPEQGEILVNGILVETGAIQIAGDARSTNARRTNFPIWLGQPSAGPVGEGANKPVTGASFGQGQLNIAKFASIVLFTDEQIEDLMNGDLNVLVDAGVRQALSRSIDAHALGVNAGASFNTSANASVFDTTLIPAGTQALSGSPVAPSIVAGQTGVILNAASDADRLQLGVSAAMGVLEGNGYGKPEEMGVLVGFGFQRELRDARDGYDRPMYDGGSFAGQSIDPLYGLDRAHSTNLASLTQSSAATGTIAAGNVATFTGTVPNLTPGAPVCASGGTVLGYITAITSATTATIGLGPDGLAADAPTTGTIAFVGQPVGVVCHKPNIHVRVRSDVRVDTSSEANITLPDSSTVSLFQENMMAVRYELRLGTYIHDAARAVVPLWRVQ